MELLPGNPALPWTEIRFSGRNLFIPGALRTLVYRNSEISLFSVFQENYGLSGTRIAFLLRKVVDAVRKDSCEALKPVETVRSRARVALPGVDLRMFVDVEVGPGQVPQYT